MVTLNRSAIVVKPKQPFLDWLHAADPTSLELTLFNRFGSRRSTSSQNAIPTRTCFDAFCCWFDFRHHPMLFNLCDEPLIHDLG
jgi:hypothetical protein